MLKRLLISNPFSPKDDKVRSILTLRQCEVIKLIGPVNFEPSFNHKVERAKR